jgi:Holliday junction resolvase RusA-like endonuclease
MTSLYKFLNDKVVDKDMMIGYTAFSPTLLYQLVTQKEYESMNAKPLPPTNNIVDEKISDEAITNMDELIRQQMEQRELELKMYGQGPIVQPTKKLNISEEIPIDLGKNENKEKSKKSVSWNTEDNDFEELKKMVFDLMETIHTMKQRLDELTCRNENENQNTIEYKI